MQPRSMTGFGRGEITSGGQVWVAEVRTVNHRYLDQRIILPRMFSALEDRVRKIIAAFTEISGNTSDFVTWLNQLVSEPLMIALSVKMLDVRSDSPPQ